MRTLYLAQGLYMCAFVYNSNLMYAYIKENQLKNSSYSLLLLLQMKLYILSLFLPPAISLSSSFLQKNEVRFRLHVPFLTLLIVIK